MLWSRVGWFRPFPRAIPSPRFDDSQGRLVDIIELIYPLSLGLTYKGCAAKICRKKYMKRFIFWLPGGVSRFKGNRGDRGKKDLQLFKFFLKETHPNEATFLVALLR